MYRRLVFSKENAYFVNAGRWIIKSLHFSDPCGHWDLDRDATVEIEEVTDNVSYTGPIGGMIICTWDVVKNRALSDILDEKLTCAGVYIVKITQHDPESDLPTFGQAGVLEVIEQSLKLDA